ncbi:MAG: D-alanine--D-alanine ligase [Cyclobacteriaceae bacterium]
MRVGIFFGGQSREREVSFAGGRTVYDNLDKSLFEPIPVFVDGLGDFVLLDWQNVYKGSIRDFFPPAHLVKTSPHGFQSYIESIQDLTDQQLHSFISEVGRPLQPSDFSNHFDFAFLALHGPYGEDGNIQGILEWYGVPYSGSGLFPTAVGIDKKIQHQLMSLGSFERPTTLFLKKEKWDTLSTEEKQALFTSYQQKLNLPFVVKSPHQGSSLGVTVLKENDYDLFVQAVEKSFFRQIITAKQWKGYSEEEKKQFVFTLTDLRTGVGFPVLKDNEEEVYHPDQLYDRLNEVFASSEKDVILESIDNEEEILIEQFIDGKEFSCIVIKNTDGSLLALPPTEIVKKQQLFDYRSKYLPGMSRKITPIDLPKQQILQICEKSENLCELLAFDVYARIDGFINDKGIIYLNDPNTTSGMMPSSFFFHQAAEIGLNPSAFLTYIIRTSISERIKAGKKTASLKKLLAELDQELDTNQSQSTEKIKVGVVFGGYSTERHISVESGRNIYEKLASSTKYLPIPIFLTGNDAKHELYHVPINVLLKDNADDIKQKLLSKEPEHDVISSIKEKAKAITVKYASSVKESKQQLTYDELKETVDCVFIALHGRPGEDGAIQVELEKRNIPYNGSGVPSSQLTINKFETNKKLRDNGILVADHRLVYQDEWTKSTEDTLTKIEKEFSYPLIAKPCDDGCSSAVKKIKNRKELTAFAEMMFRSSEPFIPEFVEILQLASTDPFPMKPYFLVEELIQKGDEIHFLEITGGLLTHYEKGELAYEIFEPSEALASGEILSLEEKFLAGEGQNITPSRFSTNKKEQGRISEEVRNVLLKTAKIAQIEGYARIDAFVKIYSNGKIEVYIIEINSLPGMTPATCIFHQTAINNYKPYDFIDAILSFGTQRVQKEVVNS